MRANLAQALAYIDQDEGPELNIAASEPGGSSKHGVSMTVLREWHAEHGLPAPDMDDMRAVDANLAGQIYTARFADPIDFDDLAGGVDYRLLDIAVNLGPTGGIRALQTALRIPVSGKMDAVTIDAARTADPATLVKALGATWLTIKRSSDGWVKYGPGWSNRANRAEPRALALLAAAAPKPAPAPPAPKPSPAPAPAPAPTPAKKVETMPPAATPAAAPLNTSVKGKTGSWKGIIGVGMNVEQFRAYVAGLQFTDWKPAFMVLHNTGAPKLSQWHSVSGQARMDNLTNYYKNENRWSAGPHAFIADDLIWPFSPLTGPGVHAPSWNGFSIGIELVGDYNVEDDDAGIGNLAYRNAVAVFAILHAKLGLNPESIRFHKEDPGTSHKDCPGKDIEKAKFIRDVSEFMGEAGGHPAVVPIAAPAPAPATPDAKKSAVVNQDNLNLRMQSSASSQIVKSLKKGTKVLINATAMNGETSWTSVVADGDWGWVSSRYLTPA